MVVADALVFHHVLQIADDVGGVEIMATCRYQRLMHVQGDGRRTFDVIKPDRAGIPENRVRAGGQYGFHGGFRAANIGKSVNVFG